MILLSDELWSIANNSKSFANGTKLIIKNNLGLYKHSDIYLIWDFQKHGSNGTKIDLARKDVSNYLLLTGLDGSNYKLMTFGSSRK